MKRSIWGPSASGFAWMLLAPGLGFLLLFLVVPTVQMLVQSFSKVDSLLNPVPGYGVAQYVLIFGSADYRLALWTTLEMATLTALICTILAYPAAWLLVNVKSRRWRTVLFIALVSPLLTSVVIRTFAWIVLLARNGLINEILRSTGVIQEPLQLLWNMKAVLIAYVQVMLPFSVLPLLTSLGEIAPNLKQASMNLGASRLQTFLRVTLPLSIPGMLTGAIIVFSLAAGSYITPLLIGGRLQPFLPIAIYQQAVQIANLPLAAALSLTLLVVTLSIALLGGLLLKRWERRTYGR